MTKRFLAVLLTLVLAFSAIMLTSCKDKEDSGTPNASGSTSDTSGSNSKPEPTNKELFEKYSKELTKRFAFDPEQAEKYGKTLSSVSKSNEASSEIFIDTLSFQNKAIVNTDTIGNPMKIKADTKYDGKNVSADANINFFDENIKIGTVLADDTVILTMPGIFDKPVAQKAEQEELPDGFSKIFESVGKLSGIGKKSSDFFEKQITDSMFTKEVRTVTVNGKEFKDAQVITLKITEEDSAKIFEEFKAFILKDEDIKSVLSLAPDFSEEELKAKLDKAFNAKCSLTASYTVSSEKIIALEFNGKSEAKDSKETSESTEEILTPVSGTIKISATDTDDIFDLKAEGDSDGKEAFKGSLKITKTGSKENFDGSIELSEDGKQTAKIAVSAVLENKKLEGMLKFSGPEETEIGMEFSYALLSNGYEFGIGKIALKSQGMDIEIPAEFSLKIEFDDKKIDFSGKLKLTIQDTADISLNFKSSVNIPDSVKITVPGDTVDPEEITEETIIEKLKEKYPATVNFLNAIFAETEDI